MIRVTCDTCDAPISRDGDRWFGVDLSEPYAPPVDPVEAMNEVEAEVMTTLRVGFNDDHEFHFCSPSCLASWAFGKELDR